MSDAPPGRAEFRDDGRGGCGGGPVIVRPLAATDSLAALTALLHRAYAPLAARGMRFMASRQDEARTARRVAGGACFVAEAGGAIVGTIVLRDTIGTGGCPWYDRPDVASFGQFAVEPAWQRRGVGGRLIGLVEARARAMDAAELALDTAEPAADLIAYYAKRGYRFVEHVRWPDVNYRSVIMSKRLSG